MRRYSFLLVSMMLCLVGPGNAPRAEEETSVRFPSGIGSLNLSMRFEARRI